MPRKQTEHFIWKASDPGSKSLRNWGQENRNWSKRTFSLEKSGLAEHRAKKYNHKSSFDYTKVLSKEKGFWHRLIWEASYIQKGPAAMTRDKELQLDINPGLLLVNA